MAEIPNKPAGGRAAAAPIVLPITSRGLELTDRLCWGVLGVAMAASAALILYLNRGTTFFVDELFWLYSSPGLSARDVIEPFNGNLIAPTRLAYKAILETVGADYLAIRVLAVATLLVCVALLYALVKRRIGALPALAPAIVMLFFGSSWQWVVVPLGFSALFSVAAGLGALLVLERGDRRGDAGGCALLCLSVVTFSTGLAFLVGVAISVLLRGDRWRRAWILLVPLALYGAWWLWALDSPNGPSDQSQLSNVLLIPNYVATAFAAAIAGLAGLDYAFIEPSERTVAEQWGYVLAVPLLIALARRIKRGTVHPSLWVSLGIVLAFWALGALVLGPIRPPDLGRYAFVGAVGVILVATDAARGVRFSRLGLVVLFAACAASLATNVALLRDGGAIFRGYASESRAEFAMLELARDRVEPDFDPMDASPTGVFAPAASYFEIVDRYGSPAFSLAEVEHQSPSVRATADRVLARALRLGIEPSSTRRGTDCESIRRTEPGEPLGFELPVGGASIEAAGRGSGKVSLGRFADAPFAEVGSVSPGERAALRIPPDASPVPWGAAVSGVRSVEMCALG
jgi:hypothetical protein